jgi:capsular exopolysaccharide synthesis family protein
VSQEQYRRLAAALHDAQVARGLKTVMVTSALPGEGKTLTVVNLALTLAESYARRVLVIDADLRWPSLHAMLGVPNAAGLSEALAAERCEPAVTEVSGRLSVMTAGQPGPAPLAGLTSERMGALLEECGTRFDWVLLDTSPVGLLPDGQVLSRLIGAVILVINAGVTPAAAVERAVADLGPECILGTVLNRVEKHRIPDADYYAYYRASANSASD